MSSKKIREYLSQLRYRVRRGRWVSPASYTLANIFNAMANFGRGSKSGASARSGNLAICLRFRDEAIFLKEWLDYYIAAGVEHFYLYNNFSEDNYIEVLRTYLERQVVTLIDWPRVPASPAAENDCIARTRGRFRWVGFIDADEFVVVRDGRSILEFLEEFEDAPAVALHWYYYGSNGHDKRPQGPVIEAYTRRAADPNEHFKVFVKPEQATTCRNSHNFYYARARRAVREDGRRVFGSMSVPAVANRAWINHYYFKSVQDYLEKASRHSTLDKSGMREPSRQIERIKLAEEAANDVEDRCAIDYLERRTAARSPALVRE